MPETTPEPLATDGDLTAALTRLGQVAKNDRHESDAYRIMESARSIDGVIRRLTHAAKSGVLDAYDVLTTKFGFEHSHELYDYLHQVPARAHLYEKAFNAETHVGCVDRAMAKVAEEALAAAGRAPQGPRQQGQRIDAAGLAPDGNGGIIGNTAAENALILATQADDANRIQRLSVDVRTITSRISDGHPELNQETLAATVRLVLHTAAQIAHEKDGVEP
ncbi:hypothetical protein [Pseudarthrobacter sp. BIM B-2242]|uniref:hypothetical protein n=1 Tax=Pseudarthrobacter sp. BIM B-2242 TaxID=2772401 RepID=UPI00168AE9FE|nr:hypothetical protein [Pseudarthrobacter sp. BIM B-2242]QOD05814.1 hypothetical protein IDT60_22735 [Pseudarthrobacter sp. BIM B-2242]